MKSEGKSCRSKGQARWRGVSTGPKCAFQSPLTHQSLAVVRRGLIQEPGSWGRWRHIQSGTAWSHCSPGFTGSVALMKMQRDGLNHLL